MYEKIKKGIASILSALLLAGGIPVQAAGENLALECPVTVSSYDEAYIGEYAVDGDPATRWASKGEDDSFITIDLTESCRITSVTLMWEAAYAEAYKIQVSEDGESFQDVYKTSQGSGGTETIPLSVTARYVRMQGISRTEIDGVKYGYSLYEFQINGLRPLADKSELTAAISQPVREDLYTPESLAAYHLALEQARLVEADIEATPDQVMEALAALLDARSGLTFRELGEEIGRFSCEGKTATASHSALDIGTIQADEPIDLTGRDLTQVYLLFTVTLTNPSEKPDEEIFNTGMIRLQSPETDGQANEFVYSVYDMQFGFHAGENVLYFPMVDISKGFGKPGDGDFDWGNWTQFRMYIDSMGGEEGPFTMTLSDITVLDVSGDEPWTGPEPDPEPVVLPGDVDGSGRVESSDALMALQAVTQKITLNSDQEKAADVDGTTGVTAADALMILQMATGKI